MTSNTSSTAESTTSTTSTTTDTTTTTTTTTSSTTTMTTSSTSSTTATTTTSTTGVTTTSSLTSTTSTSSTSTSTIPASTSSYNSSDCLVSFSVGYTSLVITCVGTTNLTVLPIDKYPLSVLNRVLALSVQAYGGGRGPLQTIPPNVCFLINLQVLNVSFNRINTIDSTLFSSNPTCFTNLRVFDGSRNYLTEYPSMMFTYTKNIQRVLLGSNSLTSFDLGSFIFVSNLIDLTNNQISTVTNNANINVSAFDYSPGRSIDISNNSNVIDFTDSIYLMYGACYEPQQVFNSSLPFRSATLTMYVLDINFGESTINCSCSQYYIQQSLIYFVGSNLPSSNSFARTKCTDGTLFYNNTNTRSCSTTSVNFNNTSPRLCTINPTDGGITMVNKTNNITLTYPYHITQSINNSLCLFTFYNGSSQMSIDCIVGSNPLNDISSAILNSIYFQNVTKVITNNGSSLSKLPGYLCKLPSKTIDLSNQTFTTLNNDSFPCSSNNTLTTINLAYNQINNVNLTLPNWVSVDLRSNNLVQFPYSLFDSTQSKISSRALSERTLVLASNQLTQIDLFVYTYNGANIDLQNNPFVMATNGYNTIYNNRKQSLLSGPTSASVILPSSVRLLLNDLVAQDYNTCTSQSLNYLIQIFDYIKANNTVVNIECQCSSIYVKEYFRLLNSTNNITNRYSCSNTSSLTQAQFESLTETNCLSNIAVSPNSLCQFARLQSAINTPTSDNNQAPAIVLGTIFGFFGLVLIIAGIIALVKYLRKSNVNNFRVFATHAVTNENANQLEQRIRTRNIRRRRRRTSNHYPPISPRPENIHYSTDHLGTETPRPIRIRDRSSLYTASIDLSQIDINSRTKRRQRPRIQKLEIENDNSSYA